MGKGYILRWRRKMSPDALMSPGSGASAPRAHPKVAALDARVARQRGEDRQSFDRWMKRNAVAGAIFAAAFIAMAILGSQPATPPETAVASGSKADAVDATVALK